MSGAVNDRATDGRGPERHGYTLAIDVGATKLSAGIVSDEGVLVNSEIRKTPKTHDALVLAQAVSAIGRGAMATAGLREAELAGVGCGCGGPIALQSGHVSPTLIPAWRKFPLKDYLESEFATLAYVDNDALVLAIGEHWVGSGRGTKNMLAVTVSTGVGGGLLLEDRPYRGCSGNAGHFGHIGIDPTGPQCECGASGCVQAFASGPNAVKLALTDGWTSLSGAPDGIELATSAAAGDVVALRSISRAGWAVGTGAAMCAVLLDLDLCVVAGGFSNSGQAFWQSMTQAFNESTRLNFAQHMRFVRGTIGTHTPLMGAAALVLKKERYAHDFH
jgi:glucokinase